MRAGHDSPTRIAALTTPRPPPGWCSTAATMLVDAGAADDALDGDGVGRAEHERAQLQRVDAEVQHRPAAQAEVEQPVVRVDRHAEAEVGLDDERRRRGVRRRADHAADVGGQEPAPHRLHQEQPVAPRRSTIRRPGSRQRQRLLAQHVLARIEGGERVVDVPGVTASPRTRRRRPGRRARARTSPYLAGMSYRLPKSSARSTERDATAVITASSTSARPSAKRAAMPPGPTIPHRQVARADGADIPAPCQTAASSDRARRAPRVGLDG